MNEKNKSIKIIYTAYDTMQDGSIRWKEKEAVIPFGKDTTEYVDSLPYRDNMEAMLMDIFESGFVFINDRLVVPVFNVKQYMACDKEEVNTVINNSQSNKNRWNNKKKFHGKRPDDRGNREKKEVVISNATEDFPVKEVIKPNTEI